MPEDLRLLRTFSYRHEGEFARALLESAGIESVLLTDDAGGMEMGLSFSNPAQLVVRDRDHEAAQDILDLHGMLDDDS